MLIVSTTRGVQTGAKPLLSRSAKSNKLGIRDPQLNFWLIPAEYDEITGIGNGRYLIRQGYLYGIYELTRRYWLAPVRFCSIRIDTDGHILVTYVAGGPELTYEPTW